MKLMNNYTDSEEIYEKPIDVVGQFLKYVLNWKWFLLSMIVSIGISVIYLKLSTAIYEVKTTVLLKDDKKGGGIPELNVLKEIGVIDVKNNVDNELEVLKTVALAERVIRDLKLYVGYEKIGYFKNDILYGSNCPISISLSDAVLSNMKNNIEFEVNMHPRGALIFTGTYYDNEYKIKVPPTENEVMLPFGRVYFKVGDFKPIESMAIKVTIQNPAEVAETMLKNITMELTTKNTSVVNIVLTTSSIQLGKDFLERLIEEYNNEDVNEQRLMAANTAGFIDNRLIQLTKELNDVESQVENYKQEQGLTSINSEANMYIQQTGAYEQKLLEVETQLAIVTDIDEYIHKKENRLQLLPTNTGIKSESLSTLISEYNKLLLERRRLSRIASNSNQAMLTLNEKIESMISSIWSTVRSERGSWEIARQDLLGKNRQNTVRIQAIPRQEREYTEIKRQQNIKEALFLYLLQKKEENYVKISMIEPKSKMIDKARSDGNPISPKKSLVLLLAFVLGLVLPIIGINIYDLLRYEIENKEELEKLSIVPVLGEILKSSHLTNVVIQEKNTDSFSEMIRLLRTNLLFILDNKEKKVINILSSSQGEGKTFTTINLGLSLALLDKKVLIIGLDIRKPKLGEYMGLENEQGITLFLSGNLSQKKLIKPSGIHPNLSIITAGPTPPNPNELLAKPLLDNLMTELRDEYDYIILDTAPVGLVSDSLVINRFADVSLYIVRVAFTHKKDVENATILYNSKKINNMYFVLNGSEENRNTYRYGYGKKNRYGYGNESEKAPKNKK